VLERQNADGSWTVLARDTVSGTDADRDFAFANAMAGEQYPTVGSYNYRIVELEPQNKIPNVTYDKTIHSFTVQVTDADWDAVIDTNLKGTFLFTRAVTRPMMKNKAADGSAQGGSIINITSVVGITGNAGQANYTASKGGVISLTKTVAKELGSRSIRCNAIAPGFIRSDMTDSLSDELKAAYMANIPLKRFGEAEDIAKAVVWLAGDDSSYVTGQIISVNGGMVG
jgi:NAD(P)-dependent dehydrogenase (short-subunit alcohol dehydrogenase family)